MKINELTLCLLAAISVQCIGLRTGQAAGATGAEPVIVLPQDATWIETLAAREVRRYIYVCTGRLMPIAATSRAGSAKNQIIVARKERAMVQAAVAQEPGLAGSIRTLPPDGYRLKTLTSGKLRVLLITGGGDQGTLYGAYRFAESMGVRFYLHGDVVPDEAVKWQMPVIDETGAPLFALRGIQPFHDFPEGPDWWNRDDYLAIIGQLPKLKMNFLALHTYPEDRPNAEPTVWIGTANDIGEKQAVKSSYPASYQNTLRGNWGYVASKTSDFVLGSAALFERDDFGPEVMYGAMPFPVGVGQSCDVFAKTAAMLHDAFGFAHQLGVKTCVGTETPLIVPKLVQDRLKSAGKDPASPAVVQELYEGIFRRAAQAYPLDYYWFWTPEGWTWSAIKEEEIMATEGDLKAAIAAHEKVRPPFALATCGWVLGPQQDRAMFDKILPKSFAVSCINREVGYTPVDAAFAEVKNRSKWAIPWLEDDPALSSPQLWAGRMRRDAFDALRYGCDGLMGIHWRTRVLGPNIGALAQAAWDQNPWASSYHPAVIPVKARRLPGPADGQVAAFPNNPISGTTQAPLYQNVRYNVSAYHLPASNGTYKVTLKFCEPHYDAAGKRVFDVKLQGKPVIESLDIFGRVGKNRALDYEFNDVAATDGWVDIEFVPRTEFPSIAAVAIESSGFSCRINCGGPAYADYEADPAPPTPPKQVLPETRDFYLDWALHQFGKEVGPEAAAIFAKIDGALPKPSTWVNGPGGIQPDGRPWAEVGKEYAFVEAFEALGPRVRGRGNQERFDYWLNTFRYFRTIGEIDCAWAEYNRTMEKVKMEKERTAQRDLARSLALPARVKLVRLVGELFTRLLATVTTPGELGTVANWNQHNLPDMLGKPGEELAAILGEALPPEARLSQQYHGQTRVIVPTVRTSIAAEEPLKLKVIVLAERLPRRASLHWRRLGEGRFAEILLAHMARGIYSVQLPPVKAAQDFEYYIKVEPEVGEPAYYPTTAPQLNQTVLVWERP